jgi:diacylglycerol O-acyltransferase / wax synthase
MVPVGLRAPGTEGALGNRVSSLFVSLPVAEPDAVVRHVHIRAQTARAKRTGQAAGPAALLSMADLVPPALHLLVARTVLGTRLFNVTVTNVPGPPARLTALGAELREIIPIVPLAAEHTVGVAILSYAGGVVICANCDRDGVTDAGRFSSGVTRTLRELRAAVENYAGDAGPAPDGVAVPRP